MLDTNTDRPGAEEQYLLATSTSDLTLNPDRVCAATHLIAAGLTGNRMASALAQLRSEWARASKPRKATEDEIAARAAELPKRHGKPDIKRARTEMLVGYAVALRHRAHQMRGWSPAMALLLEWAALRNVDRDLLSPSLYHYLAPGCPVCDGLGKRRLPDAPVLGKECHHCGGSGEWPRPLGADQVRDWLSSCSSKAKRERGAVVRGARAVLPEDEYAERRAAWDELRRGKP